VRRDRRSPSQAAIRWSDVAHRNNLSSDHSPGNAPDFSIEDYARFHPFSYAEEELPDLAPYMRCHHPDDGEVATICLVKSGAQLYSVGA
jgi:hypothetical protein